MKDLEELIDDGTMFLLKVIAVLLVFVLGIALGKMATSADINDEATDRPSAYVYSDISAQTGFLNSENIMARFECVEYYIAGDKEPVKDFLIDVYRYPELDNPVSYRVDTFEEAVMFLEGLNEY